MGMNMLEVCDGAPPRRQALVLTMNSVVGWRRPCLISLNTTSCVINLDRLAGGMRSSAAFSNSTLPLSASISMACAAAVWKPSLAFGPDTGLGAATAAATAQLTTATAPHRTNGDRNTLPTRMFMMGKPRVSKVHAPFPARGRLASSTYRNQCHSRAARRRVNQALCPSIEPTAAHQVERPYFAAHRRAGSRGSLL